MIIGVPKEIKTEENRVAVTPTGVAGFVARNHKVLIQKGAGLGSGLTDRAYESAGATIVETAEEVWQQADMIMKVKEPQVSEFPLLRPGLILFTYLHLAANESVTRALLDRKVTAIGYETIQLDDGSLPLLAPMSEIAGRLSIQVGAWCLQAENGGRGILLGGASGVRPAKVVILGAGMSGTAACQVATGMGAYVSILDINPSKLRYVHDILGGHVTTLMSNRANRRRRSYRRRFSDRLGADPGRAGAEADSPRAGATHESRARRSSISPSIKAAAPRLRDRRPTASRFISTKMWSTIASRTCRRSCRILRPMR